AGAVPGAERGARSGRRRQRDGRSVGEDRRTRTRAVDSGRATGNAAGSEDRNLEVRPLRAQRVRARGRGEGEDEPEEQRKLRGQEPPLLPGPQVARRHKLLPSEPASDAPTVPQACQRKGRPSSPRIPSRGRSELRQSTVQG